MIIKEIIQINKISFVSTKSDSGFIIQKVGTDEKYAEAIDVLENNFEYVETDELIGKPIEETKIIEEIL